MTDHTAEAKRRAARAEGHMGSYIAAATPEDTEFHRTMALIESNLATAHATIAIAEATQQPVGACAATYEYPLSGLMVQAFCLFGHNHTGAHRSKSGVTW